MNPDDIHCQSLLSDQCNCIIPLHYADVSSFSESHDDHQLLLKPAPMARRPRASAPTSSPHSQNKRPRLAEEPQDGFKKQQRQQQQQFGSTRKELFASSGREFGGRVRCSEEERQRVAQLLVSNQKDSITLSRILILLARWGLGVV